MGNTGGGGGGVFEEVVNFVVEGGKVTYNKTEGILTFVVEGTGATLSGDFNFWKRKYEDMKAEWNRVNSELNSVITFYNRCVNYYNYITDYKTTAWKEGCPNLPVTFENFTDSSSAGVTPSGLVSMTSSTNIWNKTISGGTYAITGGHSGLFCADEVNNGIKCNRGSIGKWEKFTIVPLNDGTYAIKGGQAGLYCAEENDGTIRCNRHHIGPWEKFTISGRAYKTIWMYSGPKKYYKYQVIGGNPNNGYKYCADERDKVICNRGSIGQWEEFELWKQ